MSSSNSAAPPRTAILRGFDASTVTLARMDADLHDSPFGEVGRFDARFVDPTLAKAFDEASREARELARIEGFAAGHAEGFEAGRRDNDVIFQLEQAATKSTEAAQQQAAAAAVAALLDAAKAYEVRQVMGLDDVEDLLLSAAYDLATTLLGRELESSQPPVRDAVRRALTMLPDDGVITVFAHPVDAAALTDIAGISPDRTIRIVADPDIEPGSCVAESGRTHVNASLANALRRVQEALTL
jgi:flagellar assembly protein FliH